METASGQQTPKESSKTYQQLESELKGARMQLQAALTEKEAIRQEWKQACRDLNKLQAERNFQLDDDYLASEWRKLRYEIKGWAHEHFDGDLKSSATEPPKSLTRLVSNVQPYLMSPAYRPLLVQACIWNRLQRDIFTDETRETFSGLVWGGSDSGKFVKLQDVLKPKPAATSNGVSSMYLKEFHRWRALTSWLLDNQATPDAVETKIKQTVDFLDHELSAIATSNIETERQKFRDGLNKLVTKAVRLDADFQKQHSIFSTFGPVHPKAKVPYGYTPDSKALEDNDERPLDGVRPIELVIVPALCKRGNGEGEDYHQLAILVKGRATQDKPEIPMETATSLPMRSSPSPLQSPLARASPEDLAKEGKASKYRSLLKKRT